MPSKPKQAQIEAAAEFLKGKIDPKATIERIIESEPLVKDYLESKGLIEVKESGNDG